MSASLIIISQLRYNTAYSLKIPDIDPEQLIEPLKQQLNYAKLLYALDLAEGLIDDYFY